MKIKNSSWLIIIVLLLCGCGQLEVGIEPTTQSTPTSTSVGLAQVPTKTITATGVPPSPTLNPPAITTAVPSPTPPAPTVTATLTPSATNPPAPTPISNPPTAVPTATDIPLPKIDQLSVSPQSVEPGATIGISWEAEGDKAEVCIVNHTMRACQETAVSDNLSWELPNDLRSEFVVELTVSSNGQSTTESSSVTVICDVANNWWFFAAGPPDCPSADAVNTQAAVQPFAHGWMLWLESEDIIYAFFDDGTMTQFFGSQLLGDTASGDGGVEAPIGFFAPIRGFGLVWRGEVEGATDGWVGNKLGWGLASEKGFATQLQADTHDGFYVRDINDRIIYVTPATAFWTIYLESN